MNIPRYDRVHNEMKRNDESGDWVAYEDYARETQCLQNQINALTGAKLPDEPADGDYWGGRAPERK